jgi:hypothetical protein
MTGLAVCVSAVVETGVAPGICIVAVAALPVIVTAWFGMTGLAIGKAAVIEAGTAPGSCVMAVAALSIVMTIWTGMAGLAIGIPVVKYLTAPG